MPACTVALRGTLTSEAAGSLEHRDCFSVGPRCCERPRTHSARHRRVQTARTRDRRDRHRSSPTMLLRALPAGPSSPSSCGLAAGRRRRLGRRARRAPSRAIRRGRPRRGATQSRRPTGTAERRPARAPRAARSLARARRSRECVRNHRRARSRRTPGNEAHGDRGALVLGNGCPARDQLARVSASTSETAAAPRTGARSRSTGPRVVRWRTAVRRRASARCLRSSSRRSMPPF